MIQITVSDFLNKIDQDFLGIDFRDINTSKSIKTKKEYYGYNLKKIKIEHFSSNQYHAIVYIDFDEGL